MLIMFGSGTGLAKSSIDQLAVKHDHNHLNIDPGMYRIWMKSLLTCIQKYDPKYDADLGKTWADLLNLGIDVMKQAF
jgi:hemoglobin-like flavoprotein